MSSESLHFVWERRNKQQTCYVTKLWKVIICYLENREGGVGNMGVEEGVDNFQSSDQGLPVLGSTVFLVHQT